MVSYNNYIETSYLIGYNNHLIRTFIQSPQFSKAWDEYINDDEELRKIEIDIMNNPKKYPVIPGTGSLRKMRWKLGDKGKRRFNR